MKERYLDPSLQRILYVFSILFGISFIFYVRNYADYPFLSYDVRNIFFFYDEFIQFHFFVLMMIQLTMIFFIDTKSKLEGILTKLYAPILALTPFWFYKNDYLLGYILLSVLVYVVIVILYDRRYKIIYGLLSIMILTISYVYMMDLLMDSV